MGHSPGELATPRTEDQTLGVDPFFHLTNDQVHVSLTDTVAFEPPYVYPRSYDRTMWPTKGLCVSEVCAHERQFFTARPPDLWLSARPAAQRHRTLLRRDPADPVNEGELPWTTTAV